MNKDYRVTGERIKVGDRFIEAGQTVKGSEVATDQTGVDYLVSIGKIEPSDGKPQANPEELRLREECDKLKERNAALEAENAELRKKGQDAEARQGDRDRVTASEPPKPQPEKTDSKAKPNTGITGTADKK